MTFLARCLPSLTSGAFRQLDRLVKAQNWLVVFGARSLREKQHHVLLLTHSPSATGVSVLTYFKGQPNLKSLQLQDHLSQGTAMKNSPMNSAEGAFCGFCAF